MRSFSSPSRVPGTGECSYGCSAVCHPGGSECGSGSGSGGWDSGRRGSTWTRGLLLAVLNFRVVVVVEATDSTVWGCGTVFGSPAAGRFDGARLVSWLGLAERTVVV
jgi:hypothetical protein